MAAPVSTPSVKTLVGQNGISLSTEPVNSKLIREAGSADGEKVPTGTVQGMSKMNCAFGFFGSRGFRRRTSLSVLLRAALKDAQLVPSEVTLPMY